MRVAVIDTGVDRRHPDLLGRVVDSANFVERGEAGFDEDPHGTAVAGVVAALLLRHVPGLAPQQLAQIAAASARPAAADAAARIVDTCAALAQASGQPACR